MNKLKYGSIIPDLKYRLGKNPAIKAIDHIHPKVVFLNRVPILNKIPWLGKKLFTSNGVIERKTDMIIQITPRIVQDAYTGIEKTADMLDYEDYVKNGPKIELDDDLDEDSEQINKSEEDSE